MARSDAAEPFIISWSWMVQDGQELGAALMSDVNQLPVCTCPHSELDQTDVSFPYRNTESVKAAVTAAQEERLDEDGQFLDGHNTEVLKAVLMYHILISLLSYTIRDDSTRYRI